MTAAPRNDTDQTSDSDDNGLDDEALAAIRSMIAAQPEPVAEATPTTPGAPGETPSPPRRRTKADVLPVLGAPEPEEDMPVVSAEEKPRRRLSLPFGRSKPSTSAAPMAPVQSARPAGPAPHPGSGTVLRFIEHAKAYRPTPRHIAIALLALVVFFRPWLVVGLVFLSFFILLAVLLIAGFDGFWRGVVRSIHWYARRRPARAAQIHRRLDAFAMKWDGVLDRFPEGTVDGLYLPDCGEIAKADARHDDAVKRRLAGLRENGV